MDGQESLVMVMTLTVKLFFFHVMKMIQYQLLLSNYVHEDYYISPCASLKYVIPLTLIIFLGHGFSMYS